MRTHTSSLHDPAWSLNRTAFAATLHCLTGCAIGEVLGMIIGTASGWSNPATIALSVVLAFAFGYSLTMLPLLRSGLALAVALPLAFASDSLSIAVMELADTAVILAIPGAMNAGLASWLFWTPIPDFNQIRPHEGIGMRRPLDVHLEATNDRQTIKSNEPETLPTP